MPEKDPSNYTWITWSWVILLSSWGGAVSFIRKRKAGHVRAFNISELIGELMISAFVGVLTFMLCEAAGIASLMTAALVGISGHMGSRAIFMFEKWAESRMSGLPLAVREPVTETKESADEKG